MASDKAICEVSETYKLEECDDGQQDDHESRAMVEHRFMGKALGHRAIYSRRGRSSARNSGKVNQTLPSRLSKVSLAHEQAQQN
ncbi:hypothetical protein RND71_007009 [Anisodus tanguticus]|uniref:Uncharacterized protein n=1 Tax=Anisodus tanguticus TaxID=243964 RepID=A0AAE1SUH4_9SOLA|nr:hypothetical protein RND71_007009 [Anisodus tanguticus]